MLTNLEPIKELVHALGRVSRGGVSAVLLTGPARGLERTDGDVVAPVEENGFSAVEDDHVPVLRPVWRGRVRARCHAGRPDSV